MTDDLKTRLLETVERLRRTMQGASDAEIHEIIIAAGLDALRPNVELIEWHETTARRPDSDETVLGAWCVAYDSAFDVEQCWLEDGTWLSVNGYPVEDPDFWAKNPGGCDERHHGAGHLDRHRRRHARRGRAAA